jgi:hypothetical protein
MRMLKHKSGNTAAALGEDERPAQNLFYWLFPAIGFVLALLLGPRGAVFAPDASYYRLLALGEHSAVPNPFAVRVLGPAIAGWLGRVTGIGSDRGFLVLGIVCLIALLACVASLLHRWHITAGIFAAIFLMPFWMDLLHNYFLPDLIHAAILAAILLCLATEQNLLAMVLIFPAFLARESTLLVAVCLAIAAWRRLPARTLSVGALATLAGFFANQHYGKLGAASTQGIRGGAYILGKMLWSFPRNLLGLPLWTNTLPICTPLWSAAVPHSLHLGSVQYVGLCHPSLWGPMRVLLGWFGIFGIGPAIAILYWRSLMTRAALSSKSRGHGPGSAIVFRFSVIYGVISLLLAPVLGASTDRLVEYAWPFYFVALPWAIAADPSLLQVRRRWLLVAHLFTCWIAWNAFRVRTPGSHLTLETGLAALAVNIAVYLFIRRSRPAAVAAAVVAAE